MNGIASEGPAYLRVPFGRDRSILIVHEREMHAAQRAAQPEKGGQQLLLWRSSVGAGVKGKQSVGVCNTALARV